MKTIIAQKMSGTGSIHDLASEHHNRVIRWGKCWAYAVVLPAFYNAGISRHKTRDAAIKTAVRHQNKGYNNVTVFRRGDAR